MQFYDMFAEQGSAIVLEAINRIANHKISKLDELMHRVSGRLWLEKKRLTWRAPASIKTHFFGFNIVYACCRAGSYVGDVNSVAD